MRRISIAATLGWVVAVALGLAAVVNASEFWAGATFLLTLAALLGSVLGTVLRGWQGGGWLGFAVFGWGYFLMLHSPWLGDDLRSVSDPMVGWTFEKANPGPTPPASPVVTEAPGLIPPPPAPPPDSSVPPPIEPPSSSPPAPSPVVLDADLIRPPQPDPDAAFMAALEHSGRAQRSLNIGRRLSALAFAGAGAILGVFLARGRPARVASPPLA